MNLLGAAMIGFGMTGWAVEDERWLLVLAAFGFACLVTGLAQHIIDEVKRL